MLWPMPVRPGHRGLAKTTMTAMIATTTVMRIAREVSGSALRNMYLVATKPVLQSTTKIAGAARAAN
jgi:hypothetical protein